MINTTNKIGIWGLGIVGRSIIKFMTKYYPSAKIAVMDRSLPKPEDELFLTSHNCFFYQEQEIIRFLAEHDIIIASPGINLKPYSAYFDKFISEVDLFFLYWKKPVIAITGTLGKTTITDLSSKILQHYGLRIATGGNIGYPLLDLLPQQEYSDYAVIELSSFQLEYAQQCKPDIAILTNLYPNHLDRHETIEKYLQAKSTIFGSTTQKKIIPLTLFAQLKNQYPEHSFILHHDREPYKEEHALLRPNDTIYYADHHAIWKLTSHEKIKIVSTIPTISYPINWVIMSALCDSIELATDKLSEQTYQLPSHRLQRITVINDCSFYDDSKSTIMQATHQAVMRLQQHAIILLLGGTSKGVDRTIYISLLKEHVAEIICFGAESEILSHAALNSAIPSQSFATLEEAFTYAYQQSKHYTNPAILLSPGGASYDLFVDYKDRGHKFQQLIENLKQHMTSNGSDTY